jgi:hypothetical protein
MKVILGGGDAGRVTRFVEKAQVTGQLEHPNIVPVHELGLDPRGKVFFTRKLVRGRSLEAIVERIAGRLLRRVDPEQEGGEAHVGEIDLGRPDHPLPHVLEERGQSENDGGRLQDGEPVLDRRARSAHVPAQGGEVDDLAHASGQQGQELPEQRQVAQLGQGADVPLHVGLQGAVGAPRSCAWWG